MFLILYLLFQIASVHIEAYKISNDEFHHVANYSWNENGRLSARDIYVSFNSRNWLEAKEQCSTTFHGSQLLEINSLAEWKMVKDELEKYGEGKFFWTGGICPSDSWIWDQSETPVNHNFVPITATPQDCHNENRLILNYKNRFTAHLEALQNSQPHPYVCEVVKACSVEILQVSTKWADADGLCKNRGWRLATVESEEKFNCILDKIKETGLPDQTNYWTAATDSQTEGKFLWATTGEEVRQFYPGGTGQPDDMGAAEDCVSMRKVFPGGEHKRHHEMNDERCELKFDVLCDL